MERPPVVAYPHEGKRGRYCHAKEEVPHVLRIRGDVLDVSEPRNILRLLVEIHAIELDDATASRIEIRVPTRTATAKAIHVPCPYREAECRRHNKRAEQHICQLLKPHLVILCELERVQHEGRRRGVGQKVSSEHKRGCQPARSEETVAQHLGERIGDSQPHTEYRHTCLTCNSGVDGKEHNVRQCYYEGDKPIEPHDHHHHVQAYERQQKDPRTHNPLRIAFHFAAQAHGFAKYRTVIMSTEDNEEDEIRKECSRTGQVPAVTRWHLASERVDDTYEDRHEKVIHAHTQRHLRVNEICQPKDIEEDRASANVAELHLLQNREVLREIEVPSQRDGVHHRRVPTLYVIVEEHEERYAEASPKQA